MIVTKARFGDVIEQQFRKKYSVPTDYPLLIQFSPQALNVIVVGQLGSRGMPALLFFEMGSY